jgi:hypothetical protein
MASILKVDTIQDQSGNNIINENADTITIGASGDTIVIPSGATLSSTDPLVFPAGTALLPAVTTTGDVNTGIFFPAADTIAFTEGGTEAMRINSSGQVGIGTSSPAFKLEVNKGSAGDIARFTDGVNANTVIKTSGSIVTFGPDTSNSLALQTNNTERMRITSSGGVNVGSGVVSSASNDGNIVVDDGIYIGTYNGDNQIRSSSAGGGSATLYIGNAAIQVSSDRRLKTNIADTTMSAVDKIKQVRIVDFNWNDPSDTSYNNRNARGTWTGVIAQELIDVFPFAVNAPRKEEDLSIDTESEKKWQVDQAHLVPVLMKAIQEQQTIIEELKATLTSQQSKIDALEARITTLENN